MEDFKLIKNNFNCGFISNSEFIEQWDDTLREHGLAFSYDISSKLEDIRKKYNSELREVIDDILEKQGCFAK